MKKDKLSMILIAVVVILVLYIGVEKYMAYQEGQLIGVYQQGYQAGAIDTVGTMLQQTDDCQVMSIQVGNNTRRVVDVACLSSE